MTFYCRSVSQLWSWIRLEIWRCSRSKYPCKKILTLVSDSRRRLFRICGWDFCLLPYSLHILQQHLHRDRVAFLFAGSGCSSLPPADGSLKSILPWIIFVKSYQRPLTNWRQNQLDLENTSKIGFHHHLLQRVPRETREKCESGWLWTAE